MRIFYASERSPNAHFTSNLWRNNLYVPLVDLGHDVVEFDYDLQTIFQKDTRDPVHQKYIRKHRPLIVKALLEQIKAAHAKQPIDLFFSYLTDACITPEALQEIRDLGIKTMNWYCNGSYRIDMVSIISPHYDWCLVPEKFRLKDYKKMGANAIYCQEAANPMIYKPYDVKQAYDVSFVGQAYGERPGVIHQIMSSGINLQVGGFGWERFSESFLARGDTRTHSQRVRDRLKLLTSTAGLSRIRSKLQAKTAGGEQIVTETNPEPVIVFPDSMIEGTLSDTDMIKMYSRSKINLGFSGVAEAGPNSERIVQVRLRDFEVPMSGGFYMIEYMEELEEFFEIGKEIVCYTNTDDLIDKIKYYLVHDKEREKIRKAGHKRCLRDHSWQKRFTTVFEQVGLQ